MGIGLSIELPDVLVTLQNCELICVYTVVLLPTKHKLYYVASNLCARVGSWSKVQATLDRFVEDDYDFLIENSDVEKLTGLSADEVKSLATVISRRPNSK